jgi:UDP-N-acetylglucosamine 2-epimerase (non-hydrolysing)
MIAFEKTLLTEKPDWVVVVGDVNATLAYTITAKKKLNIKVCHIEAGIRSNDSSMPEEINRIVTDSISDLLLTPDQLSYDNLLREGKSKTQVNFVGNIMIDTLDFSLNQALAFSFEEIINKQQLHSNQINKQLSDKDFCLITIHRPSNVDDKKILEQFIDWLGTKKKEDFYLIWTVHPRTLKQIQLFNLTKKLNALTNVILLQALSYLELLKLNSIAKFVITDSGGLQEECCVLGTPFLVLRSNTERSMTLIENGGTGYLVGGGILEIEEKFKLILKQKRTSSRPKFWDGKTAERCLQNLISAC